MSRVRLTATVFALGCLLISTAAFAQAGQKSAIVQDQAQNASPADDEVSTFVDWFRAVDPGAADVLFGDDTRTTSSADTYCESAIDPGGLFCTIACECECNYGYLGSQCCCEI